MPKSFSIFLCTDCGRMDEDTQSRSCLECGSTNYIKRYVTEWKVNTFQEAVTFYIAELERDWNRLGKLLNLVKGRPRA